MISEGGSALCKQCGHQCVRQGGVVVKRERVTDASGRRWVSGELDADAYFSQARERARRTARATVAQQFARLRPEPKTPPR